LKIDSQYIIHFKGLKEGVHDFTFTIGKPFFEAFDHLEVPDGNVSVQVKLIRKFSLIELDINLSGEMQVQCDRCLANFQLPVSYSGHLVVRFSETEKEPDEEVIFLHPDEYRLDLRQFLYECLCLSIPLRKIHPDLQDGQPGCDPEMLGKLDQYLVE